MKKKGRGERAREGRGGESSPLLRCEVTTKKQAGPPPMLQSSPSARAFALWVSWLDCYSVPFLSFANVLLLLLVVVMDGVIYLIVIYLDRLSMSFNLFANR